MVIEMEYRENGLKRPEILAPAGSMESLKAAVAAGCDAVYAGGSKFGQEPMQIIHREMQ